jgi:hypothetical protein
LKANPVFLRKRLWFTFGSAAFLAMLLTGAGPRGKTPVPAPAAADSKPPDPYAGLAYRFIGPPGNRVSAVAGVPGDPNACYDMWADPKDPRRMMIGSDGGVSPPSTTR